MIPALFFYQLVLVALVSDMSQALMKWTRPCADRQ